MEKGVKGHQTHENRAGDLPDVRLLEVHQQPEPRLADVAPQRTRQRLLSPVVDEGLGLEVLRAGEELAVLHARPPEALLEVGELVAALRLLLDADGEV